MRKLECVDREKFCDELYKLIIESQSNSFQFVGKNGTGKEYVLENLEKKLRKKSEIYRIFSDTLIRKGQRISTHTISVAFSLNGLVGMSLSPTKNDSHKINYIIANLKSLTLKKNILISAIDYDILPPESRDFINILLCNKNFIEEKINKKISIIITSNVDYFNGKYNVETVIFRDYDRADIYNYLINVCGYTAPQITNTQLTQIYKLCGTNLNLVKNYAKLILSNDETSTSIESIIDTKLNYYIRSGEKYNLSKEELQSILLTSSMSIHMLTTNMISYINSINEQSVQNGFYCALSEKFIEEELVSQLHKTINYSFISEEEKKYLYNLAQKTYKQKTLEYYIYLSEVAEDEYFERSQYLFRYYDAINKNVFALIMLGISKSFMLNDILQRDKITSFFLKNNTNERYKELFNKICEAYINHYQGYYQKTLEILENIDYSEINIVLAAELRRLIFNSGYIGHIVTPAFLNEVAQELHAYLEQRIFLSTDFAPKNKDEKILSLRIIFELAPYVLDTLNDKERFCKLYDDSLLLTNYINNHFIKKSFSEYIINVFNRKAFLFAVPSQASVYYEQAVAYFKDNKIWDEYVIALASKAGNEIALQKYSLAINNCSKAITTIEELQLEISQEEKIYNNLYIAEFLYFESNVDNALLEVQNKAISISEKLEKLLTATPCGMNHVILTNIASLYLYAGKEDKYLYTKQRLEASLGCKDVSAVKDVKINNFYRYHFAWYEFYLNLMHHNWKKCSKIINLLDTFYPSVFHNTEKMDLRVQAARNLVKGKIFPDIKKYGLNMLQYAPSDKKLYFSRGLPLSDLQFTSWE